MKELKRYTIIQKEGEILYKAITYFSNLLKEKGNKDTEVLVTHQLYQDYDHGFLEK